MPSPLACERAFLAANFRVWEYGKVGSVVTNATNVTVSQPMDIYSLILSGSAGFVGGFALGYAVKKILKILLLGIGLMTAAILYLDHIGVVEVKWNKFQEWLVSMVEGLRGTLTLYHSLSISVPLAGFGAGFLLGLKYG